MDLVLLTVALVIAFIAFLIAVEIVSIGNEVRRIRLEITWLKADLLAAKAKAEKQ